MLTFILSDERKMPAIIEVSQLTKCYRKHPAVKSVDLNVSQGEIYGLIGPDGAGKSSVMQILAGVLRYDSGQVKVFGQSLASDKDAETIKSRIGFMPQGLGLNLYPELTIEENINFFADLRNVPKDEREQRKQQLLDMTQLNAFRDRPMKNLSGGMKQKLGLVCTLIHKPELVILDEPTTGVDPVSRRDFWEILSYLVQHEQMTALVSTSYMDEAERFQNLSFFYEGKVLAQGEPDSILEDVKGWVAECYCGEALTFYQHLKTLFSQVEIIGERMRIVALGSSKEDFEMQLNNLLKEFGLVHDLFIRPIELEDVFIGLLARWRQKESDNDIQQQAGAIEVSAIQFEERPAFDPKELMIEAKSLSRFFGDFVAVDEVSFDVKAGEIFGLLGANGAGKSTAIKMLTGLLKPSQGYGHISQSSLKDSGIDIKQKIGYMSQSFSLYADLTVHENLKLYGQIYGVSRGKLKSRIEWALKMGSLQAETDTLAGRLPMGLRQRLALGCALLHEPKVLFLDEPTSGVDPLGRQQFWEILVSLAKLNGVAILVTTHYMSEAEHCDNLALMQSGRIVAQGSPQSLRQQVADDLGQVISIRVDRPYDALSILKKAQYEQASLFGKRVHLFSLNPEQTLSEIEQILHTQQVMIRGIQQLSPSLEDVFIHFIETEHSDAAHSKEVS
ncbi:ATP-binding cassette domain-containing protein [Thiomicrorhabdus chilensis]|uniref:ATP-binding cassette domain-containing protein n=1 Tax=Thiomicrorhabdus chilensis TaxID=63656 RepID=UPI001FDF4075|nr:ATP-binding cassette domain-containing protein [Thiomicrorhabdus chilensis]